jgi:hypothetical protein
MATFAPRQVLPSDPGQTSSPGRDAGMESNKPSIDLDHRYRETCSVLFRQSPKGNLMMKIHDASDLKHMSAAEIEQIIHDEHVNADQLNIFAAYFRHLNSIKKDELKEIDRQMAKVEEKLRQLGGS